MSGPLWTVRVAGIAASDLTDLATFSCASSLESWELEVEAHVRYDMHGWLAAKDQSSVNESRNGLLVFDLAGQLAAVAAHHWTQVIATNGDTELARHISVVAVERRWHGCGFGVLGGPAAQGRPRASEATMNAVMDDILELYGDVQVAATVHKQNVRSLRLMDRQGLCVSRPTSNDYVVRSLT